MIADSLNELHTMADRIGLKRRWFQNKNKNHPHYDISASKRRLALRFGAKSLPRIEFIEAMKTIEKC